MNLETLSKADHEFCEALGPYTNNGVASMKDLFALCRTLPLNGELVECGVHQGAGMAIMARAQTNPVVGFDSFEGAPFACPLDVRQPDGGGSFLDDPEKPLLHRLRSCGLFKCDLETVLGNLQGWGCDMGRMVLKRGWFQHTMPRIDIPQIALLRLDCDLYESSLCAMINLYPHLIRGGMTVIDSYPGTRLAVETYLNACCLEQRIQFAGGLEGDYNYWIKP